MTFEDGVATLEISPTEPADANGYTVRAKNKNGDATSSAALTVHGEGTSSVWSEQTRRHMHLLKIWER